MLGASLTSAGGVSAPESADCGHFYPVSPLVPGPGEKEGSACLGTGTTGTYLNVHDHQHSSFPQGEVEGAVGVGPFHGSAPEESYYHGIAGQEGRHLF